MTPDVSRSTDLELLNSAQLGNRESFAVLYGRYWPRAVKMATVVCNSSKTAKDVVRISFADAWRTCTEYRTANGTVHSWLFGIVRSQAAAAREGDDMWGRQRYSPESTSSDSSQTPIDDDVGTDAADAIALLLADAPSEQRELVAMAFFGELSPTEISLQLGLSEHAVRGRMRLGLNELRERDFTHQA